MVRWAFAAVVLCACYAPHPPQGAPCDDDSPCPTGQVCIAGFCDGKLAMVDGSQGDAMADSATSTPADLDGDGVLNAMDNCPNYSNKNQGDEDGDMLGDPCDPCPIDAVNPPVDPDNDGVSDSCDPRPTLGGDTLTLFEGFHAGVPVTWQVIGTAMQAGDDISLSSTDRGALVSPVNTPTNGVVMIKARVIQTIGNFDSALGPVALYNPTNDNGIHCELYSPNATNTNNRTFDLWDGAAQQLRGTKAYGWQNNTQYTLAMRRTGTNYVCQVTPMGGVQDQVTGTTNSNTGGTKTGAFLYGANVTVSWMMVVTSP